MTKPKQQQQEKLDEQQPNVPVRLEDEKQKADDSGSSRSALSSDRNTRRPRKRHEKLAKQKTNENKANAIEDQDKQGPSPPIRSSTRFRRRQYQLHPRDSSSASMSSIETEVRPGAEYVTTTTSSSSSRTRENDDDDDVEDNRYHEDADPNGLPPDTNGGVDRGGQEETMIIEAHRVSEYPHHHDQDHSLHENILRLRQEMDEIRNQQRQTPVATVIPYGNSMIDNSQEGDRNKHKRKKDSLIGTALLHTTSGNNKMYIVFAIVVVLAVGGTIMALLLLLGNNKTGESGSGTIPSSTPFPTPSPTTSSSNTGARPTMLVTATTPTSEPTTSTIPTSVPSSQPTTIENWVQVLADILNIQNFNSLPSTSPEIRALEWMAYEDQLRNELVEPLLLSSSMATTTESTNENNLRILSERYAAVVFYFATNGPIWINQDDFLSGDRSICHWNNGFDINDFNFQGIYCDSQAHVVEIDAGYNRLDGTLPSQLGEFSSLTQLYVTGNTLRGTIPESFGSLLRLESFSMAENLLTGTLPSSLGSLTSLETFHVTNNFLSGTIPESFSSWTNMVLFFIHVNNFSGSVPESFGTEWKQLNFFSVPDNELTGTIPNGFGSLSSLTHIWLYDNEFIGNLDEIFCPEQTTTTMPSFSVLEADCLGPIPEITCTCCTTCH